MKKVIWKYKLQAGITHLIMPKGAEILTVQTVNREPYIWALINPEHPKEQRVFEIYLTGTEIDYTACFERNYINSFEVSEDVMTFVFHVFELIKEV